MNCVYAAGSNLGVGSGAFQLILPLPVVGLSLVPGLAALVPVVPRDAYVWKQGTGASAREPGTGPCQPSALRPESTGIKKQYFVKSVRL